MGQVRVGSSLLHSKLYPQSDSEHRSQCQKAPEGAPEASQRPYRKPADAFQSTPRVIQSAPRRSPERPRALQTAPAHFRAPQSFPEPSGRAPAALQSAPEAPEPPQAPQSSPDTLQRPPGSLPEAMPEAVPEAPQRPAGSRPLCTEPQRELQFSWNAIKHKGNQ